MTLKYMWMWDHWKMFGLMILCCQEMLKLASGLPDPFSWEASASCARLSKAWQKPLSTLRSQVYWRSLSTTYKCSWSAFYFTLWLGYLSWKSCCFGVAHRTSYYSLQWLQDFEAVVHLFCSSIYHPEFFWSCVALYVCPLHVCVSPSVSLTYRPDILGSCRTDFKGVVKPGKSWKRTRQKIYWHWCSLTQKNANILQWSPRRRGCPSKNSCRKQCCFSANFKSEKNLPVFIDENTCWFLSDW